MLMMAYTKTSITQCRALYRFMRGPGFDIGNDSSGHADNAFVGCTEVMAEIIFYCQWMPLNYLRPFKIYTHVHMKYLPPLSLSLHIWYIIYCILAPVSCIYRP